ncbi:MAG: cupin domain-containing protein [Candidatus Aenigmarchaeota archaeon]|nr:cupin domain-containing protein [Candidatus Aenigmarchaeota archaeon]
MIPKINIKDKVAEIAGKSWHPVEVARVNDQVVRMALCKGEYHWHKHSAEDELFYVLQGELTIQMREPHRDIILHKGEMAVIPKNVEHCPKSAVDTYVLMFEPVALKSKGDQKRTDK